MHQSLIVFMTEFLQACGSLRAATGFVSVCF
jgi:hypothetical protein